MLRGPLYRDDYRQQLSGHETFPLRYGWLKKAFDAVRETEGKDDGRSVFLDEDAIARFGVGKNMVASIRHWAVAAGIITDVPGNVATTTLGRRLFDEEGLDPYMEHPATSWLIHWHLCGRHDKTSKTSKTSWFWAFNYYPATFFERDTLVKSIDKLAKDRGWAHASNATIVRDVSCFVRTYVAQLPTGQASHEDALESPLTELGLIKQVGKRDGFRFVRGQKPSLGMGVFSYAVTEFWSDFSATAQTLSFEALAHEPGSPGRVFLLDENDVLDRLVDLEDASKGIYRWSETAGLKQVIRGREPSVGDAVAFVEADYDLKRRRNVA